MSAETLCALEGCGLPRHMHQSAEVHVFVEPYPAPPVCGLVMPRTNPPGCFTCTLPAGHAEEWHDTGKGLFGDPNAHASWRDEPPAAKTIAIPDGLQIKFSKHLPIGCLFAHPDTIKAPNAQAIVDDFNAAARAEEARS